MRVRVLLLNLVTTDRWRLVRGKGGLELEGGQAGDQFVFCMPLAAAHPLFMYRVSTSAIFIFQFNWSGRIL
jgi:hypothetical protein